MFSSLALILPAWYYRIVDQKGANRYWANVDLLPEADRMLIDEPLDYLSRDSALLDMAYQAWIKGILVDEGAALESRTMQPEPLDEYIFTRRHFNPWWAPLLLIVRLLGLHNPIREIRCFIASRRISRINPFRKTKNWKRLLEKFQSELVASNPRVSVVIPTLNRYPFLREVLKDLEKQDFRSFEVIIVDQSEPFDRSFYESFDLEIKVRYQEEKALWLARNVAITESSGELILLCDDDSRVQHDWIRRHIECLDFFKADISSGVSISVVGSAVPPTYSYYKWGDQIDTGNVMLRKEVFRRIGLFDRQFENQRKGDGEFGLRAYLAGYKNISNPDAPRIHLKAAEGGLRQMGSWDAWRPKKFFAPRPVPSVLYFTRKYFGDRAAMYQILQSIPPSIVPYRFKSNRKMLFMSSIISLFLLPIISISLMRSWRLATKKLKEGSKIATLE